MGWWSSKSTTANAERVGLGIDLNATRVRAATGRGRRNRIVLLDDPHADLPLAISLEKRTAEVGRAGLALVRRLPHLACTNYLPQVAQLQEWKGGRHQLDGSAAMALVFAKLAPLCAGYDNIYLTLPSYLRVPQVTKLIALATKARLPVKGSASMALALAADRAGVLLNPKPPQDDEAKEEWNAPPQRPGKTGLPFDIVIVDADDHALTGSLIRVEADHVALAANSVLPKQSTRVWKTRLLDSLSDRCVHVCRRDPRDSAEAEQALYEQIDDCLDRIRFGQKITLTVRSSHWYQDLILRPDEFEAYCSALVREAVTSVTDLITSSALPEPPRAVWMTHEASRLPGFGKALHQSMAERTNVGVLRPDAAAASIANLGERWHIGDLPTTHLDTAIPVAMRAPDAKIPPSSARVR